MGGDIKFSVVVPAYNEEGNVRAIYGQLKDVLSRMGDSHEIIFIDDGSTDGTFGVLNDLGKDDDRLKIIRFGKRQGQTAALNAGFQNSRGDIIFQLDADLQNDPGDMPKLLEKLGEHNDCVCGWRHKRLDPFSKRMFARMAYCMRQLLIGDRIHDSGCSLRAYKRECIKSLRLRRQMHRYIPELIYLAGYKVAEVEVSHHPRKSGKTKYGSGRLLHGFADLIFLRAYMGTQNLGGLLPEKKRK